MRTAVFTAAALWLMPVISAAGYGLGFPVPIAVALAAVLSPALSYWASRPVADALLPASSRGLFFATIVFAAIAIVQIGRISVFMIEVRRTGFAFDPSDPWRTQHCCLTAYAEAARFASTRRVNVYDPALYEPRFIETLKVDPYHYPPPFLLLPRALQMVADDFRHFRALWFSMQALVLAGVVIGLACWLGGRIGAYALAGGVLFLASPQAVFSLQQTNFQSTAVALAVVAFILLCSGRIRTGAPVLAFVSVAKVFPGVLILYLLAARRWRAVAWTAIAGILLVVVTLLAFGPRPFADFLQYEVPRLSNGEGFPQAERPNTAPQNQSVYGLTVRLRMLGADWLNAPTGRTIASVYGLLVLALTALLGVRQKLDTSRSEGRLALAQTALALVVLGSFRSPFVGFYGLLGPVWLFTLLAAGSGNVRGLGVYWAGIAVFAAAHVAVPSPSVEPPVPFVWLSTLEFSVALLVTSWPVLRQLRARQPFDSPRPAPVL